jgi:hypothetical protein
MSLAAVIELLKNSNKSEPIAPDTARHACEALSIAFEKNPSVVLRAGGIDAATSVLQAHIASIDVVFEATRFLGALTSTYAQSLQ